MSCLNADVVVLLFATDRPQTLARVSSYWMPELRRLHVTVPVVLVGTKSDLKPNDQHLQQVRWHRMGLPRSSDASSRASDQAPHRDLPYGHVAQCNGQICRFIHARYSRPVHVS